MTIFWHKERTVKGRDIILVDDIFDTGKTINAVKKALKTQGAKSVTTVTLLDKVGSHPKTLKPDYSCFKIPTCWVVGYGLDTDGMMRNFPYVGVLRKDLQEEYSKPKGKKC